MSNERRRLTDLIAPHLRDAPPYAAVTSPETLAEKLGLPIERIVKLDANENPYGPTQKALGAIASARSYHIYPDPAQEKLRRALGDYVGFEPQWVMAGAGSDELIDLLVRLFAPPGQAIVNFPPTFGMYPFLADVQGARIVNVTRRADYTLDLAASVEAAREACIVFAVSPNNPTGTPFARDEIEALLATGKPVVVDEAYAEFAGDSFLPLVREHSNLIVLRTLSKWAGLAGLRIGYMIAAPELIETAMRLKQPYNINAAAEVAALASLADLSTARERIEAIVRERERLSQELSRLPGFTLTPSKANFVLCRLDGVQAREVHARLVQRGVLVRYFDTPLLSNHIRISAGRPGDTDALLASLNDVLAELAAERAGAAR